MNRIINRLLEEYDRYGVRLLKASTLNKDVPDVADLSTRQVIININSELAEQIPFRLAHELMHIVHAESYSHRMVAYHTYDVGNSEERMANNEAIKLLLSFYREQDIQFTWLSFMELCGIPRYLECRVKKIMEDL